MKKINLFIVLVAFFAMNLSAAVNDPVKPSAKLRAEILQLIDVECNYMNLSNDYCTAEVLFTINNHNEVVVISVNSPIPNAEKHIGSKLNYKKVNFNGNKQGVFYLLPIKIINQS